MPSASKVKIQFDQSLNPNPLTNLNNFFVANETTTGPQTINSISFEQTSLVNDTVVLELDNPDSINSGNLILVQYSPNNDPKLLSASGAVINAISSTPRYAILSSSDTTTALPSTSTSWAHPTITSDLQGNLYATDVSANNLEIFKSDSTNPNGAATWIDISGGANPTTGAGSGWAGRMSIKAAGGSDSSTDNADIYIAYGSIDTDSSYKGLNVLYSIGDGGSGGWTRFQLDYTRKASYVSMTTGGYSATGLDPASDKSKVYISYQDYETEDIYFKAHSFFSGIGIGPTKINSSGQCWASSIAIGPNNGNTTNVFIVWIEGTGPYSIKFRKSIDNGNTWESEYELASGTYTEKAVTIVALDDNKLFVSYTKDNKLYLRTSSDGGMDSNSWTSAVKTSGSHLVSYVNNMFVIATNNHPKIYISYYGGSIVNLKMAYSSTGGDSEDAWLNWGTSVDDARLNNITVSNEKVYIISGSSNVKCCKIELN